MKQILDNAAGPTGVVGIMIGLIPDCPADWLIFFSTGLIICQLIHWGWRFINWLKRRKIE